MRSHDLLPDPEPAASRFVVLPGGEDAPAVDARFEGWTRVELTDLAVDERPLLVVPVGGSGSVVDVLGSLDHLRPSTILVLADEPANDPRIERAVVRLAAYGNTVERVEDLEDGGLLAGVLLVAGGDGGSDDPAAASRAARQRLEDLRVGSDAASGRSVEALRRRLRAAERARSRDAGRAAELEQELRQATRELALERHRLDRLERSTSYRLGQAVVQSIRDPRQVGAHARELIRRWRRRGGGTSRSASPASGTQDPAAEGRGGATARPPVVTTVPAVAAPRRGNAVAAIVSDRTAHALEDEVLLTRLLPHDAAELIAAVSPQVVLIESGACEPGGPWVGAGSGAVPARDRDLQVVTDAADRAGAATVLVWSGPRWRAPGLAAIAERCTLEVAADEEGFDWVLGVPPARIHAEAHDVAPGLAVLEAAGPVRRPTGLAGDLARVGLEVGGLLASDPWSVWAGRAAWLVPAGGPDRWQLAAAAVAGATPVVRDPAQLGARELAWGAVSVERAAGPWHPPTWGQRCRAVLDGGTVASLRVLGELLGRDVVTSTARSVAVRLAAADETHVDALLAQRDLPPGSVAVVPAPLSDRATAALEAVGVRVTAHVPADTRFDAELAADGPGPDHLTALLAGWELTRAPIVGRVAGGALRRGRVGDAEPRGLLVERDHPSLSGGRIDRSTPAVLVPSEEVGP